MNDKKKENQLEFEKEDKRIKLYLKNKKIYESD